MGRDALADEDPLSKALAPPPDETEEDRLARVTREAQAKKRSDEIDSQLQAEKSALKKKKKWVKVLLLGQSESGKSTTLKNFQMAFSPRAWADEKSSWRSVIQLNLTRTVNTILDKLAVISERQSSPPPRGTVDDDDDDDDNPRRARSLSSAGAYVITTNHQRLMRRLGPLREVQKQLERRLGKSAQEEGPWDSSSSPLSASGSATSQEFFVRSGSTWKSTLKGTRRSRDAVSTSHFDTTDDIDEVTEIIRNCREDIKTLWADDIVKRLVRSRRIGLQDSAEFYMRNVDRIARRGYAPSDDDVVRARLRTVGVLEHRMMFEAGADSGSEWVIYDVGGGRSSRAVWPSYFDDMTAIIFLAPINVFDEQLTEDKGVNRLEDSLHLWKALCSNKLLKNTELVLFLNKCDLLEKKLKSGVRVKDSLPSYADRANDMATFSNYMNNKFSDIFKSNTKTPRKLHTHLTSVVDTEATAVTINAVHDSILKLNLRRLELV